MRLPAAIVLISAAAIAYEIVLIRIFSVIQWHHFAAMVISLALLGYGVSGTLLTLAERWLKPGPGPATMGRRHRVAFTGCAVLFGVLVLLCSSVAQRIPFNPLALVWEPQQLGYLAILYLLLAAPFVCAASCIGMALAVGGGEIPRLYRSDLIGAGSGAAAMVAAMFVLPLTACLRAVALLGLLAASLVASDERGARRLGLPLILLVAGAVTWTLWPGKWLELRLSEFKPLSKALLLPDARILAERSSPLGLLTVVESPTIPFRHAPGLSLAFQGSLPAQLGVFTDGDSLSVVDRYEEAGRGSDYLGYLPSALPYQLLDRPAVLILGAGGGSEIAAALKWGAVDIDAVEFNQQMSRLLQNELAEYSGDLYRRAPVKVHIAEARSYLRRTARVYDLVQISLVDSSAASTGGTQAVSESYLYTVEAMVDMLGRLRPGGMVTVTRWLQLPPRGSLKLLATAIEALRQLGVDDPAAQLAVIRGWGTVTALIKNGVLDGEDIGAIRDFCEQRSFDFDFYSGMRREEANRYNRLEEPYLYDGVRSLLSDPEGFYEDYKFNVEPATDDRPFFFHFFKWSVLRELLSLRGRAGTTLVEWGYLILVATAVQAAAAGAILILLPLRLVRRAAVGVGSWRVFGFFTALGLAFLMLEIAFIQRFTLYLGHPLYSVAVVLTGFLVFAGLGSGYTRSSTWLRRRATIGLAIGMIVALSLLYVMVLPILFRATIALPDVAKVAIALSCLAPLAFFMGMPFPLGLLRAVEVTPVWVPWAWGINGCASVTAAALAPVIAIHFGFTVVVFVAISCYLVCGWLVRSAPLAVAGVN